jgi:hypothetical protein
MNSALFDRIRARTVVPWQSRGSPAMITERARSNRNKMELNGTKPKVLELTETLLHLLKNCYKLLKKLNI